MSQVSPTVPGGRIVPGESPALEISCQPAAVAVSWSPSRGLGASQGLGASRVSGPPRVSGLPWVLGTPWGCGRASLALGPSPGPIKYGPPSPPRAGRLRKQVGRRRWGQVIPAAIGEVACAALWLPGAQGRPTPAPQGAAVPPCHSAVSCFFLVSLLAAWLQGEDSCLLPREGRGGGSAFCSGWRAPQPGGPGSWSGDVLGWWRAESHSGCCTVSFQT